MELLEAQYAQYYAMTAVPPFDPHGAAADDALAPQLRAAVPASTAVAPLLTRSRDTPAPTAVAVVVPVAAPPTAVTVGHVPPFDPAPSWSIKFDFRIRF